MPPLQGNSFQARPPSFNEVDWDEEPDEDLDEEEEEFDTSSRHMPKSMRDSLHKPKSDWRETSRGEKCYNHSSLEVKDIISKYGGV